jgi:hypothetical protein
MDITMKKILLLIFIFLRVSASAQYSNYYNVNKNIAVSGNLNISTIDYGQLALANAQREKNNLEKQKYIDQREKDIYLAITADPLLAYDYGTFNGEEKARNISTFSKLSYRYVVPHKSLFVFAGALRLENVSSDGVTTEINLSAPWYNKDKIEIDLEKNSKMEKFKTGELNDNQNQKFFVHKKDVARATVWGFKGFLGTVIWEDDYQYTITDNYASYNEDNILNSVKVRYYGNKKEVTFEQLEGRRYYLKRLIEKVISTATIYDYSFK